MAMIPCPECKYEISDKSLTCPKCGCLIPPPLPPQAARETRFGEPVAADDPGPLKINSFFELFVKVWVQPRKTIRRILDSDKYYGVWLMMFLVSCASLFPTDKAPLWAQLVALPFIVPLMYLFFWVVAMAVFAVGLTFGAKARLKEVFVTTVWTLPLNVAQFIIAHGGYLQGPAYYVLLLLKEFEYRFLIANIQVHVPVAPQ